MTENEIVVFQDSAFGKKVKRSALCPICIHSDIQEIHLMRARDHMTFDEISNIKSVNKKALRTHFDNHWKVSLANQRIIALKEEGSPEANELVGKILEGDFDIFSVAQSIADAKAERLIPIQNRISFLSSHLENDDLEEEDIREFHELNKLASNIENEIMKVIQIVDKKLFPVGKEALSNAILTYKLNTLSRILDSIQIVFSMFERKPEYQNLISEMRNVLAAHFNSIENEILKSGGIIQNVEISDETEVDSAED